ncbi:RDD family protein [Oscillospiraceae bacterium HV4-5-C5C]|nr:RDD family protein [Oscillospiraceae bacterium HV4-5-C5C]
MSEQADQQAGGTVPTVESHDSTYSQTPPAGGSGYNQTGAGSPPPYQGPPSSEPVLVMGYPGGERRYVRLASRGRRVGAALIDRVIAGIPVTIIAVILLFRLLIPMLSYISPYSPYNYQNQAVDPSAYSLTSQEPAADSKVVGAQQLGSYDPYAYDFDFDDFYPESDNGSDYLYASMGSAVFLLLLKYLFQVALWSWGIDLIFYVVIPLFTGGRTLGKLMLNLRPVKARGQLLTRGGVLGRQLLMLVLSAFVKLISLLTILFTEKYQALHDFICDTVVIDERPF